MSHTQTIEHNVVRLQPAKVAINDLRRCLKRVGKPGGNLNERMLRNIDVIEAMLNHLEHLGSMATAINQQTQVWVHSFRTVDRLAKLLPAALENGDDNGDEPSETKGE